VFRIYLTIGFVVALDGLIAHRRPSTDA